MVKLFIFIYFLLLSAYWFIRIYISNKWLAKNRRTPLINRGDLNFIIIIPVLNEGRIIKDTIEYFLNLLKPFTNSKLVIVTTNKEWKVPQTLDTFSMCY